MHFVGLYRQVPRPVMAGAEAALRRLRSIFGGGNVYVETVSVYTPHNRPWRRDVVNCAGNVISTQSLWRVLASKLSVRAR